ncbi:hypothetical protein B0I35DRAFT_505113 [Stachybotrys elegans]|uniref:Transcription factor domain-containing protein n=1 Tax=Stachybotrys elegans TaxID=80388 RepID=A0A8K0WR27_9HYPO|nr:hypothetical protein B0I35DRAFT_505113 [Stachybotrys elegans]
MAESPAPERPHRQAKRNACLPCRRKRAKVTLTCFHIRYCVDVAFPPSYAPRALRLLLVMASLTRCVHRGDDCSYQDRVWRTKDDLRSEISKLQDGVTQALELLGKVTADFTPEVMEEIRRATRLDSIMGLLGMDATANDSGIEVGGSSSSGDSVSSGPSGPSGPPGAAPLWTRRETSTGAEGAPGHAPPISAVPTSTPASFAQNASTSGFSYMSAQREGMRSHLTQLPLRTTDQPWAATSLHMSPQFVAQALDPIPVSLDQTVLDANWHSLDMDRDQLFEIINVYFTWELPGYGAVEQESFMKDLLARRRRYCCEALVIAIMARSYQMMESGGKVIDKGIVYRLYNQAQTMLTVERAALETEYPYIQTLTVLSSIDIVSGRGQQAWNLAFEGARLAIVDALDRKDDTPVDEEELTVRANTFCGAVSLPRLLRLVTLRLDPMEAPMFMRLGRGEETAEGRIERAILLQRHFWSLLRHTPSGNQLSWEVTEILHTFMLFHFDEDSVRQNKGDLFEVYPQLQQCWDKSAAGANDLDLSVGKVYNCLQYHFSILTMFKPYINDPTLATTIAPRAVLANSANIVIQLAWQFKMRWGLGLVHLGFPYIVGLATETMVYLSLPEVPALRMGGQPADGVWSTNETACKGIMMLAEMGPHHASAREFLAKVSRSYQQHSPSPYT